MKNSFSVPAALLAATLLATGCKSSVMPKGFEGLKVGQPVKQFLETLLKDPVASGSLRLRTPAGPPLKNWPLSGSPDEMLTQMNAHIAEYQKFLKELEQINPLAHASDAEDLHDFMVVFGPESGFKEIQCEFEKAKDDSFVLKSFGFDVGRHDSETYQTLVAQAGQKLGRTGKSENSNFGCDTDTTAWELCDDKLRYTVSRYVCPDSSSTIEVEVAHSEDSSCNKKATPAL